MDERFEYLFRLLHDTVKMEPLHYGFRIQNTAGTIGLLVDRYEAKGDLRDLERASRLADWLIRTSQREDGAYYNHGTKYTSVIYIAKSMLELALAERDAGEKDVRWQEPETGILNRHSGQWMSWCVRREILRRKER